MKKVFFLIFFLLVLSSIYAAEKPFEKVTFVPQWVPQAQFAGYYVALEKGIYKKYGIDVEIVQGGPRVSPIEYLKDKKTDFATMWLASAIQERDRGVKLVNIAQIIQRSSLMFIAKRTSGIQVPADMNGKKVGIWPDVFKIQPEAFFQKYGLKVKKIPQSFSINLFLHGGVDVVLAMWYNEYHLILNAGYDPEDLNTFFFYDYGLNFPEDGIYVLEETFKAKPELCKAFVKASLEGWQYAFENKKEAVKIILKYQKKANIPANSVHQKWMLTVMESIITGNKKKHKYGVLNKEDYDRVIKILKEEALIKKVFEFKDFYKGLDTYVQK